MTSFHQDILSELKTKDLSEKQLTALKRALAVKHKLKTIPTNINILLHAPPEDLPELKKQLLTKPVRTISGVSPVAIMTAPSNCPHGKCTFCPGGMGSPWGDVPQSYTGHEPATMRGMRNHYDSYLQVFNRLEQYAILGHSFDKIEVIVMGGTFPATAKEYQEEFILGAFQAMNDFSEQFFDNQSNFDFLKFKDFFELPGDIHNPERTTRIQQKLMAIKSKNSNRSSQVTTFVSSLSETATGHSITMKQGIFTLENGSQQSCGVLNPFSLNKTSSSVEQEQQRNETAAIRCVALCIETKPDWGFLEHGNEMLRQGCTRVELGIESVYDDVLLHTHRGHTAEDSTSSIQLLRDLGFKINFHYMPGLPNTDRERDIAGMKQLFDDPAYRPDMIKLYPTMVAPGTALHAQYQAGQFMPISTDEAAERIVEFKKACPEYCRIQRIQRDVPTKYWIDGVGMTNFRQYLFEKYKPVCRCIRCREPKGKNIAWDKVTINIEEYDASGGKEFFLAAEDPTQDILIGFCRLRFPSQHLRSEITPQSALIRELHVYGTATAIGEEGMVQHRGWGKKLMQKAEEIAKQNGKNKIVVIAGVGVREYYKKLGYGKEGPYMVKEI